MVGSSATNVKILSNKRAYLMNQSPYLVQQPMPQFQPPNPYTQPMQAQFQQQPQYQQFR